MSVSYVFGRSGSGKTEYVFTEIKKLLNENSLEKIFVIVPEQATFRMEREIIEKCSLEGLFNLSVLSFDRLVYVILSALGGRTHTPLDFIGKAMIARTVLDENKEKLKVFRKSASKPGFEIKIAEQLSELKRQDVTTDDLLSASEMDIDEITKEKIDDISILYNGYQDYISEKHLDNEDLINQAIQMAEESDFFSGAHVFIDGFDLLTNQVLRLLSVLLKNSKNTILTFKMYCPSDNDKRVFDPELKLMNMVDRVLEDLGITPNRIDLFPESRENTKYKSNEIYHLQKNLFAYPFYVFNEPPKDILLSSFDNKVNEVKNVCAKIISFLNEGYRFRDMALCVGDISLYRTIIKSIFDENEIPFFMDAKRKLMQTSFAEFLVSLLDFLEHKDIEDFIIHMKSGFLDIEEYELNLFENHIKRYRTKGYMLSKELYRASENIEETRKILSSPVFELLSKNKKAKTAEQYGKNVLEYLRETKVDENIEAFSLLLEERGELDDALVYSQVFEKIIEIINQSCLTFHGSNIPFSSFVSAVKAGMEAAEIAIIPPSTDDILVGDFGRTVFPESRALFILGLNDGQIPTSPDTSSILTDIEKIKLEKHGLKAGYRDRFFEERMKIYTIFSNPSEKLFLSFSNSGKKGSEKPSVLVGRIQKIFSRIKLESESTKDRVLPSLAKSAVYRDMCISLNKRLEGLDIAKEWRDVFGWFETDKDWRKRTEKFKTRLLDEEKEQRISNQTAKSLYSPLRVSVSRVERYYNCPFLFFMDYGIMPRKEEEFEETPLDMGTFLHDCLHQFVLRLKKQNKRWSSVSDEEISSLVDTITSELKITHNNGIFREHGNFSFVFERLKLEFLSATKVIRDQLFGTEVDVYASELEIRDESFLNLRLSDGSEVSLVCKADRLDYVNFDDVRIIRIVDYKSSTKTVSLKDIYYGLNLQLLVYLKIIVEYFRSRGETVVIGGAYYMDLSLPQAEDNTKKNILKLRKMDGFIPNDAQINNTLSLSEDRGFVAMKGSVNKDGSMSKKKVSFTPAQFDILFKYCEKQIVNAMEEIIDGNITPKPYLQAQRSPCENCDYNCICGFDKDIDEYRIIRDVTKKDLGLEE